VSYLALNLLNSPRISIPLRIHADGCWDIWSLCELWSWKGWPCSHLPAISKNPLCFSWSLLHDCAYFSRPSDHFKFTHNCACLSVKIFLTNSPLVMKCAGQVC
jgi:hypothetical protein